MTTLFGWGPAFGCPSPSPFVMKSEMQLTMLGVDFDRAVADLESVSKHKAPYVRDDGKLIQDSNFIRAHFEDKLGKSLDDGLSDADQAAGWALERMAEGHLRDAISTERWLKDANFAKGPAHFFDAVPAEARDAVVAEVRDNLAKTFHGAGFGRHSEAERLQLAARDVAAISQWLDGKAFLFGDAPSGPDAAVSAMLISGATEFFDTPLVEMIRSLDNLVGYMERIEATYFAENRWPSPQRAAVDA